MHGFLRIISVILIYTLLLLTAPVFGIAQAAEDKEKPGYSVVKIFAPQDGYTAKIGDTLEIMILVKPTLKVASIAVLCEDGRGIGMVSSQPFSVKWDTSGYSAGTYKISAQAHLEDGRIFNSPPVEIILESPPPPAPAGVLLKEGTPIILSTEVEMVSGKVKEGSVIHFRVDKEVIGPQGQILIPCDSTAYGKVLKSRPHGMFGRPGKLDFLLESVEAADGTSIPLRAVRDSTGNDEGALVVVGALLLSVLFVFFCGHNVEIPRGTLFTAYVNHDTMIMKPQPTKLTMEDLDIARTVTVKNPADGATVKKSDKIQFSCTISPADDKAYVRVYLDKKLIAWQKGNLTGIEWSDSRKKDVKPGEHELYMEVTFSSGHIVESNHVKFALE